MDNKEAIEYLKWIRPVRPYSLDKIKVQEAIDLAIKALEERPQGEWIKVKEERCAVDMSGEIATRYKCSECGRTITILPSKLADYLFCHCGAKMKKGGAE